jgi:hypothetical protein
MENELKSRRVRMDLWGPIEHALFNIMQEIEKMGADVLLTKAVTHLGEARYCVSDYIEEQQQNIISSAENAEKEYKEVRPYLISYRWGRSDNPKSYSLVYATEEKEAISKLVKDVNSMSYGDYGSKAQAYDVVCLTIF